MFGKLHTGRFLHSIPNQESIVVAARSQLTAFVIPFQTAHFLLVADQLPDKVAGTAHITMVNEPIPAARGERVLIPRQGSYTGRMTVHGSDLFTTGHIPQLNQTPVGAYSQMGSLDR